MPCCGRPDSRAKKSGEAAYYSRYSYLSSSQRARQAQVDPASRCKPCAALTVGDPCTVCGMPKTQTEAQ